MLGWDDVLHSPSLLSVELGSQRGVGLSLTVLAKSVDLLGLFILGALNSTQMLSVGNLFGGQGLLPVPLHL